MDGTMLVWDLRPPPQALPPGGAAALWEPLAGKGAVAYRAGWALADHPAEAIAFLQVQLKPAPTAAANGPQVERWLADLDSDKFAVREAAAKGLAQLGAAIEPRLRKVLEETSSTEVRRRVQALLDDLAAAAEPPEAGRQRRALRALEQMGSLDSRQLLQRLSQGAPEARLTLEAKASLERLARRPPGRP
jgi:hypothetical protein